MRYLIPIILSLSMLSMGNAREEEDCNCEVCLKDQINQRIKIEQLRKHEEEEKEYIIVNFNLVLF